jgi:GntR family transcriptional regulator
MIMNKPEQAPGFRPLYAQIKDLMLGRLASGQWRPGDLLPSEPKLAEEFGVSQGTARKALDTLADMHLLVRRQGKGTYVTEHTPDRALFHFFHLVRNDGARQLPESRVLGTREGQASPAEREHLDLPAGSSVIRIDRLRSMDGVPVLCERLVVSAETFPGLADRDLEALPNTIYELYEREFHAPVASAVERLSAIPADAEDARLLGLTPGSPLLQIDRVALGHDERPVEWRVSRCDSRNHHYLNELR